MAVTPRQRANLKRGRGSPEEARAAIEHARQAKRRHAEQDDRMARHVASSEDPWLPYRELHDTMNRHIKKLLRAEERSGGLHKRELTDRLREYRQTTEALAAYQARQSVDEQARA